MYFCHQPYRPTHCVLILLLLFEFFRSDAKGNNKSNNNLFAEEKKLLPTAYLLFSRWIHHPPSKHPPKTLLNICISI